MTDTYEGQSVQVKQVERAVERLADCVEDQEKLAGEIALALDQDDVEGFEQAAKRFSRKKTAKWMVCSGHMKRAHRN